MENLIFSLNATVPVFLLMILGMFFKKIGWVSEKFAAEMNKFVFLVPLPVLVFKDLATVDFQQTWDSHFVLFCFGVTILSIIIAVLLSFLLRERSVQGEFIQASYRSSAALLGIALINNVYGGSVMGPLMILGSVPLYNIMAVIILSFFHRERKKMNSELLKSTLRGIVTNPIIIGIAAGCFWSIAKLPYPPIFSKTVDNLSAMATPLGLIAMGATFNLKKALGEIRPIILSTFMKLFGYCILFLPLAVKMGFIGEKLIAILIMLGSATTTSSFVMAKNMGHEGILSSSVIMLTILLNGFSITFWIFLLRSFGLI